MSISYQQIGGCQLSPQYTAVTYQIVTARNVNNTLKCTIRLLLLHHRYYSVLSVGLCMKKLKERSSSLIYILETAQLRKLVIQGCIYKVVCSKKKETFFWKSVQICWISLYYFSIDWIASADLKLTTQLVKLAVIWLDVEASHYTLFDGGVACRI